MQERKTGCTLGRGRSCTTVMKDGLVIVQENLFLIQPFFSYIIFWALPTSFLFRRCTRQCFLMHVIKLKTFPYIFVPLILPFGSSG